MGKQYVVINQYSEGHLFEEDDLPLWLRDGSIEEGDQVYEVKLFGIARKKTHVYLEKQSTKEE